VRAILVRIGVDSTYGRWNAPADPASRGFVYVPIPEATGRFLPGCRRAYSETLAPLERFRRAHGLARNGLASLPRALTGVPMHLDPDFDHLTYGDVGARRGSEIKTLTSGDLLVFYAGLRSITDRELIYAIVGLYVVDRVMRARDVPDSARARNAHTRRRDVADSDIVVFARAGVSGRCARYVGIGVWRDRAYRVREDLLEAWGGVSAKGGYIQRSARPPRLLDPARFSEWWRAQDIALVARNFDD